MKFLKSERFRLKNRYLQGEDSPPLHVDEDEWKRLKEYWNTNSQKSKAQSMALARQSVKSNAVVGRKAKVAKEVPMVSTLQPAGFEFPFLELNSGFCLRSLNKRCVCGISHYKIKYSMCCV